MIRVSWYALKLDLGGSCTGCRKLEKIGCLGLFRDQAHEYQNRIVGNNVTTDAKGWEGGGFVMTLAVQCGICKAPLVISQSNLTYMYFSTKKLSPTIIVFFGRGGGACH